MVLPWLPATATPYLRRISSASISARGITGTPRRRASATSGLSGRTAVEVTTTWAPVDVARRRGPRTTRAPSAGEALGRRRALQVGARHRVAEVQQHLGDAAHAGAADADEVHVLDAPKHAQASGLRQSRSATRAAASGRPRRRAACSIAASRSRVASTSARSRAASDSPAELAAPRARAPRPPPRARARSCAGGRRPRRANGTSIAALPATVSSAQVVAPLRERTRSASPKRRSMSSRNAHDLGRRGRRRGRPPRPRSCIARPRLVHDAQARRAPAGCGSAATSARFRTREPWLPPKARSVSGGRCVLPRAATRSRRAPGCR